MTENPKVNESLASLKIDRAKTRPPRGRRWTRWWIVAGASLLVLLGGWNAFFSGSSAYAVETYRVSAAAARESGSPVVLNAAGYVVPHYKIEVASKVVGRVAWIGVEKGDEVRNGQVLVRLEDDEYRARAAQAQGRLASLRARLQELEAGSRPEEIALAKANLEEARAEFENSRIELRRAKELFDAGVIARQEYDTAKTRADARQARAASLERAYELRRIGPREEEIDAVRGEVSQALGEVAYSKTMLDATIIRAPSDGTILERNVEIGEFVTTGFVGERGAKGYVVSLADLNDIQVELDISQDDFARLRMGQKCIVTTDAYRDREYKGEVVEISPEADRQKATVQVKVQILEPDSYLRPEMNANVAFQAAGGPSDEARPAAPAVTVPVSAVRGGNEVFLLVNGRARRRAVRVRGATAEGVEIAEGLSGGEDVILDPPAALKDGDPARRKES